MSKSSKILIVVDPTQGFDQASVTRGSLLAKALKRDIELLIIHTDREFTDLRVKNPAGWQKARHKVVNTHADHLEGFAAILSTRGHDVVLSVVCDWPLHEGIVRHALYTNPHIVVKETHHHSKLRRFLFSDGDWKLARFCPQPLWFAKADLWRAGAPIMVCVDPDHENDAYASLDLKMLSLGGEFARKLGSKMHVFNAYPPSTGTGLSEGDEIITPRAEFEKLYAQKQRQQLASLLKDCAIDDQYVHMELGFADQAMVKVATSVQPGVVILGSTARNNLERMTLGSTTQAVLDELDSDVVLIKPGWFECPVDAISHADAKYDPPGHIFQVKAGTRAEWAANKICSNE